MMLGWLDLSLVQNLDSRAADGFTIRFALALTGGGRRASVQALA